MLEFTRWFTETMVFQTCGVRSIEFASDTSTVHSDRKVSQNWDQPWSGLAVPTAEIGALEAFRADPSLKIVRAMTREVYGETPALPAGAVVYFSGVDASVGALTKYALTELYADAR